MALPSSGPLSLNDIQTEFGGTNPIGINEYYAGGGLVPAGTSGTYGAVPTSGQISIQNFYGTSNYIPVYIEDLFSTYLYTGTGADQTITNGINLSGSGGLVWNKSRSNSYSHSLIDTTRGAGIPLFSNLTSAQQTSGYTNSVTGFTSTGFTLGADSQGLVNNNGFTYASWTFREQPKFFDIVTYTGNGVAGRQIAHNLGSVPGAMIVKSTSSSGQWPVYHRSTSGTPQNDYLLLNQTAGAYINQDLLWNNTAPTSTVFTVGSNTAVNANGVTYVAYLFAHNAGGFGLTGTDNVISCGSFTGEVTVNLGYEPQWVLTKKTSAVGDWVLQDTMRGIPTDGGAKPALYPNLSAAESTVAANVTLNSTGFSFAGDTGTRIYIAIRRGPMKTPTTGTSVMAPVTYTGDGSAPGPFQATNFPVDLVLAHNRGSVGQRSVAVDRLRGGLQYLDTNSTSAESASANGVNFANNTGVNIAVPNAASQPLVSWNFRRAPSFFDEVCYTGTGAATTFNHNLGAVPELMIVKNRGDATGWQVYHVALGATKGIQLQATAAAATSSAYWNDTSPNSSVFTVGTSVNTNESGFNLVAYLFASCPGVSKVGSYSGTGATQTINCGFTGGARFVLIKRIDTTGDWYVWDTARGMVSGTNPSLLLNSTAAEVNANSVYTTSVGFQIVSTAAGINASGGTYIYLAIA